MKYNTGRMYNKRLSDGGANYNSGPFIILILDNGSGVDNIKNIFSNLDISDTGIFDENIALFVSIDVIDKSNGSNDKVSVINNINISDSVLNNDFVSIMANLNISETASSNEFVNIAGAFFVIDSNNILHPLGVLVTRDSRYELLPATRDATEEIPGRHGEIDFGTELKTRSLELSIVSKNGLTPLEKSHLQRLIAKYLDPTKGYKTLIFSDDVEKTYMVKYSGKIDLTKYPNWFQLVIPFKMKEPFIVSSFENILVGSGTLINKGTHETGLTIEISGPTTNPTLTIGDETLSYTGTIPSGQKLIIDTEKQIVKIGNTNALANYNEVFPLLYPGETTVNAPNNVTIKWRDKWI